MKLVKLIPYCAAAALVCPGAALADTQSYIDLQAALGYSTNPLLIVSDNPGSGFGRFSAYGYHGWSTERSKTELSAYAEDDAYLNHYSNKQVFDLSAATTYKTSETVNLFGKVGFNGDVGGQLSSRFYGVPPGSVPVNPTAPGDIVTGVPDLYAFNERQYRLSGQLGASASLSARDSLNGAVGAQHFFFTGTVQDLDYTQYDGSLAYEHQLSERLTLGAQFIGQYSTYSSGGSVSLFGPRLTLRDELSADWTATAAVGVVRSHQSTGGSNNQHSSFDLALDGSLCRERTDGRLCFRIARSTQSSVVQEAVTSSSLAIDYYQRLTAKSTIQATMSAVKSSNAQIAGIDQSSSYYGVSASYNRTINDRLSAGANLSARKLMTVGPNPNADFGGSLFIGYRIGDVR